MLVYLSLMLKNKHNLSLANPISLKIDQVHSFTVNARKGTPSSTPSRLCFSPVSLQWWVLCIPDLTALNNMRDNLVYIVLSFLLVMGGKPSRAFVSNSNEIRTKNTGIMINSRHKQIQVANVMLKISSPELSASRDLETGDINQYQRRLDLLNDALHSFNSSAAQRLLEELNTMRQENIDQAVIDDVLNNLLVQGPDQSLPLWAKLRPFARYSRRARMASLRRTLDCTTPPPNVEDESDDDAASQQRRRRRALISLLRTLSSPDDDARSANGKPASPAVVTIEKRARREQKGANGQDMIARRPTDLETPAYSVLAKKANFEVRMYEPFAVCSVAMSKPRPVDAYKTDATVADPKMGGARAFGALAGYLFGKNQQEQAMAMTTPVFNTGSDDDKQMSFVLPSVYWKEDGISVAPQPFVNSGVKLERNGGGERAVLMFGGYASKNDVKRRKRELLASLAKDKVWEYLEDEPVALAQYNDPFTPPWKRLNEVSIGIQLRR